MEILCKIRSVQKILFLDETADRGGRKKKLDEGLLCPAGRRVEGDAVRHWGLLSQSNWAPNKGHKHNVLPLMTAQDRGKEAKHL